MISLRNMRKCWAFFWRYKVAFIFNLFGMRVLHCLIGVATPMVYASFISHVLEKDVERVFVIGFWLATIYCSSLFIEYIMKVLDSYISRRVINSARKTYVYRVLQLPGKGISGLSHGMIQNVLMNDISSIVSYMNSVCGSVITVFTFLIMLCVVFSLCWELALIMCCMYPMTVIINLYYSKRIKKTAQQLAEEGDQLTSFIKDMVGNLLDIKNQYAEIPIEKVLDEKSDRVMDASFCQSKQIINNQCSIKAMNLITYFVFTGMGVAFVLRGRISFEVFLAFITYAKNMSSSFDTLVCLKSSLQPIIVSLERLDKIDTQLAQYEEDYRHLSLSSFGNVRDIQFENTFAVFLDKIVLENIELSVVNNCIIGIYGANGSGKTTIGNLLLRNLEAGEGRILFNGHDICGYDLDWLHRQVSYLGEKKVLYRMSIKENLLLYNNCDNVTQDQINKVCDIVGILDDINRLTDGFDTIIHDEIKLSTGQVQKILLARIILRDTPVIILDEALSNLDSETKNRIKRYLISKKENKIIFIISHDRQDYSICDEVYCIENRKIVKRNIGG